jgi:protein-tyrosine-phosphatase
MVDASVNVSTPIDERRGGVPRERRLLPRGLLPGGLLLELFGGAGVATAVVDAPARRTRSRRRPMSELREAMSVLPVEQRTIVRHSADKLRKEFRRTFGVETIELYLASSLLSLQAARIKNFVLLFSERFARQRLRALARVEGKMTGTVPSVVFLCTHNAGRSQMAAAWAKALGGDRLEVFSGGSDPASEVNPAAIEAMREVGIDIKREFPKPWTDEVIRAADVIITMGCGDACPTFPGKRYEDWEVEDPAGQDVEQVRPIRDDIESRVKVLLTQLGVT